MFKKYIVESAIAGSAWAVFFVCLLTPVFVVELIGVVSDGVKRPNTVKSWRETDAYVEGHVAGYAAGLKAANRRGR